MGMKKAIVMEENDNVATVMEPVDAQGEVVVEVAGGRIVVRVSDDIPFGHKFAIRNIPEGSLILKYGEPIGIARMDIKAGQHVHVHNLESKRGRGDQ